MPIIYSLVSRGSTVLAEYTEASGNFTTVTQSILEKIPSTNGKMSYVYDRYVGVKFSPFHQNLIPLFQFDFPQFLCNHDGILPQLPLSLRV